MIKQYDFFSRFNAKCDCCKKVTSISKKVQLLHEETYIVGEMQFCSRCYNQLMYDLGLSTTAPKAKIKSEKNDSFSEYEEEEDIDIEALERAGFKIESII